jgi:pseudaminic acid biosynthesis-associated methylase
MSDQLAAWQGEFGDAYTERNRIDPDSVVPFIQTMLNGLAISSALEIGCNRGHNLLALTRVLGGEADVVGIEPNRHARESARSSSPKIAVLEGQATDLPFKDGTFDLVMTAGLLIHISLEQLPQVMREIYRVSRRYVLAVEYFAEQETVIPYRGHDNLLWKRDFLGHYQTHFPDLILARSGYFEAWDRCNWWLLEKGS